MRINSLTGELTNDRILEEGVKRDRVDAGIGCVDQPGDVPAAQLLNNSGAGAPSVIATEEMPVFVDTSTENPLAILLERDWPDDRSSRRTNRSKQDSS